MVDKLFKGFVEHIVRDRRAILMAVAFVAFNVLVAFVPKMVKDPAAASVFGLALLGACALAELGVVVWLHGGMQFWPGYTAAVATMVTEANMFVAFPWSFRSGVWLLVPFCAYLIVDIIRRARSHAWRFSLAALHRAR